MRPSARFVRGALAAAVFSFAITSAVADEPPKPAPGAPATPQAAEFPPFADVLRDHERVSSDPTAPATLYTIWLRRKDGHVLAEIPKDFADRRYFVALTISSGEVYAGLQCGEVAAYWRAFDRRIALVEPNLDVRSSGDPESQRSVQRLFTDRVILETPILTIGPGGGPVIDFGGVLNSQASKFFGPGAQASLPGIFALKTLKAFPQNVELAFEEPAAEGRLKTLHYSWSLLPDPAGYQTRLADPRVGYFTDAHDDFGRFDEEGTKVRFIHRWRVEKRDPSLRASPPRKPIVFYLEHAMPIRYRSWVKQGILAWNAAFEKIGIRDAIEVRQQDALTGEHMEKDPEDIRYNFVRWLSNDIPTAIGPSRVHPLTGEILDADIVLTDGWVRVFLRQHEGVMPAIAHEGLGRDTLEWIDSHPAWDARRLLDPTIPPDWKPAELGGIGAPPAVGIAGQAARPQAFCSAAAARRLDLTVLRAALGALGGWPAAAGAPLLDGMPEEYIGPLLRELTMHEAGHTLGLRHNFRASAIYALSDIQGPARPGLPIAASVMDYLPVNFPLGGSHAPAECAMPSLGPYDFWAIEYGYSLADDLKPTLARSVEPELQFSTDEDTVGPDPLARRYDLGADPIQFATGQMALIGAIRKGILEKHVGSGESWAKARRAYEATLALQLRTLNNVVEWVGGIYLHHGRKGDGSPRAPHEVVPAAKQRDALRFLIDNAMRDDAYGLDRELLTHLASELWLDQGENTWAANADWRVEERVLGVQVATLTRLLAPTRLRRVSENETRVPADIDALTLPELLDSLRDGIWSEIESPASEKATARRPLITGLRRNLQREHVERLIDLAGSTSPSQASRSAAASLALEGLRGIGERIGRALEREDLLDPYSIAHLRAARLRIDEALDASRAARGRARSL